MASAPALTFAALRADIRRGKLAPVYVLHGGEGYFIDRLVDDFTAVIDEADRDFNLFSIYGSQQLEPSAVIEACRRYPMMADRQVVILKEAQAMRADQLDKLARYVGAPTESTVLVICFRGAAAKGKELMAQAKLHGVIFESKKLTDRTVGPAIAELVKERGLKIEPKGVAMLRDFIGADLAKLYAEVDKLAMILPRGAIITPEAIETNVGISKDYNNFELNDALSKRDYAKAMEIVAYFKANPKNNPTPVTLSTMFGLFANVLVYHMTPPQGRAAALGFKSEWQLRNLADTASRYTPSATVQIISALRRFDAQSKGNGSRQNEYDLLRDLIYRIFTAR